MKRRAILTWSIALLVLLNIVVLVFRASQDEIPRTLRSPLLPTPLPGGTSSHNDTDISVVAFVGNGHVLAAANPAGVVTSWDPDAREGSFGCHAPWSGGFIDIDIFANESLLATLSPDQGIRFWSKNHGGPGFQEEARQTLDVEATCITFKPQLGSATPVSMAVGLIDGSIRILEFQSRPISVDHRTQNSLVTKGPSSKPQSIVVSEVNNLSGHASQVTTMSFSRDGRFLASAASDRSIQIWDTSNWQLENLLFGHSESVTCISFNDDGTHLVTASKDGTVIVWDWQASRLLHLFSSQSGPILGAVICGNPEIIVTASEDRKILLWPLDKPLVGRPFNLGEIPGGYVAFDLSTDGKYLAMAWGNLVKFWSVSDLENYIHGVLNGVGKGPTASD